MFAACYSNTKSTNKVVKFLIDNKANLYLENNEELNTLMIASKYVKSSSNLLTIKYLVDTLIENENKNIKNPVEQYDVIE
jgi:hypothetical protein